MTLATGSCENLAGAARILLQHSRVHTDSAENYFDDADAPM